MLSAWKLFWVPVREVAGLSLRAALGDLEDFGAGVSFCKITARCYVFTKINSGKLVQPTAMELKTINKNNG